MPSFVIPAKAGI